MSDMFLSALSEHLPRLGLTENDFRLCEDLAKRALEKMTVVRNEMEDLAPTDVQAILTTALIFRFMREVGELGLQSLLGEFLEKLNGQA